MAGMQCFSSTYVFANRMMRFDGDLMPGANDTYALCVTSGHLYMGSATT